MRWAIQLSAMTVELWPTA